MKEELEKKGKTLFEAVHSCDIANAIVSMLMDMGIKVINYKGEDLYVIDKGLLRDGAFLAEIPQGCFRVKKKSVREELENTLLAEGVFFDEDALRERLDPSGKLLCKDYVIDIYKMKVEPI